MPVEAALVLRYSKEVHNETYGRNPKGPGGYTKDYVQLSRLPAFKAAMDQILPPMSSNVDDVRDVVYVWPGGEAPGAYDPLSAERPHLRWEYNQPPPVWRMTPSPTQSSLESIPGDPNRTTAAEADDEFDMLGARGAGQPYLVAVKLRGEVNRLHLRTYLDGADPAFGFADLRTMTPPTIQRLASSTSNFRLLQYQVFDGVTGPLFDPNRVRGSWLTADGLALTDDVVGGGVVDFDDDSAAESADYDADEIRVLSEQADVGDFAVPDATATVKTRGSAQRVFASQVKNSYGNRCALTGVSTPAFLVASHIVPWSADSSIRLDPSNGICLSLLVDRAFEGGYLIIQDDLRVNLDRDRVGSDAELMSLLSPYDGAVLRVPSRNLPRPEYLRRRRGMFGS